jgi:hypothetical protein
MFNAFRIVLALALGPIVSSSFTEPRAALGADDAAESVSSVKITARTTDENKECGSFRVIVKQGSTEILNKAWGGGQNWDDGHVFEITETPGSKVNGDTMEVIVRLEEGPGERNIDWHTEVTVAVGTSKSRALTVSRYCDFDTDVNKPYHEINLGKGQLK